MGFESLLGSHLLQRREKVARQPAGDMRALPPSEPQVTKIQDRDQVVDVAARLFTEKGFDATSLDDIASELGTVRSALYYYVSGKAELRSLIQTRRVHVLVEECEAIVASNDSASAKLAALVQTHLAHFARHYPESRGWSFITTGALVHDQSSEELHAEQRRVHAAFRDVIAEGVRKGELNTSDPSVAAMGILGMCHYVTTWYRPNGRKTIAQIGHEFAQIAIGGIRDAQGGHHQAVAAGGA